MCLYVCVWGGGAGVDRSFRDVCLFVVVLKEKKKKARRLVGSRGESRKVHFFISCEISFRGFSGFLIASEF